MQNRLAQPNVPKKVCQHAGGMTEQALPAAATTGGGVGGGDDGHAEQVRGIGGTSGNTQAAKHASLGRTGGSDESEGNEVPGIFTRVVRRLVNNLATRFPRAARCLQSPPIARAEFVKDAAGPVMPKEKMFKAHLSIVLCHYHVARTIVLGASFSVWAAFGSPAAMQGVTIAWVLALFVAVLTALLPWLGDFTCSGKRTSILHHHNRSFILMLIFCPFLYTMAILPLSALFMIFVKLSYSLACFVLAHIGPNAQGEQQVWIYIPKRLPTGICKWSDTIAGPMRTCLSWLQSTSIFSHADGVLGWPQGNALAFTSTSYATLAGGLSCFWVLLAITSPAPHAALARARSFTSYNETTATANDTKLAVVDMDRLTGEWSWVWGSLIVWLSLGVAIVLCCCSAGNVLAGKKVYSTDMEFCFPECWVDLFVHKDWDDLQHQARLLVKISGTCSLFATIVFIFTASQTAEAKELIATTYTSSFAGLSASHLDWDGVLPSFDEVLDVMSDPQAALSSVVECIANLSRYAEVDPAYLANGVRALQAINLVLSFVKLLATYARKLFALVDTVRSILKTYTGYQAASGGDDGTVQLYDTMTDLSAMAILNLLNKQKIQDHYQLGKGELSFAKLVLQEEELSFEECNLADDDLAELLALVTHPEMTVKSRSLCLAGNNSVTAQAWKKVLPKMLINANLTHLKCASQPRLISR